MPAALKAEVFGQDHVIEAGVNSIRVAKIGRRNGEAPIGSYMFMGPSGTGKTQLTKCLAQFLFDDVSSIVRFDMSEYMEKHSVSKLIGAPPGYDGFDAGGALTEAVRRKPYAIILFDEMEKAHPDVFNILLQVLSDGRLTDNVGRTVSFRNAIVIVTTNVGQKFFLDPKMTFEEASLRAKEELSERYPGEFLNRFAGRRNILCFDRLSPATMERIAVRELNAIAAAYSSSSVKITIDTTTVPDLCTAKYDVATGARGLPGYLASTVEAQIVNAVLDAGEGAALDLRAYYDAAAGSFKLENERV